MADIFLTAGNWGGARGGRRSPPCPRPLKGEIFGLDYSLGFLCFFGDLTRPTEEISGDISSADAPCTRSEISAVTRVRSWCSILTAHLQDFNTFLKLTLREDAIHIDGHSTIFFYCHTNVSCVIDVPAECRRAV